MSEPEPRYRLQSLRTGWAVEAPQTEEGTRMLKKLRKKHPDKFKYCRVRILLQMHPEEVPIGVPFELAL